MSGIKPDQEQLAALAINGCLSDKQTKEILMALSKEDHYYQSVLDTNFYKSSLTESEIENKSLRESINKAALKILELEREQTRMKWLFARVLDSLPVKRDWLDPDYEKGMKFFVNGQ